MIIKNYTRQPIDIITKDDEVRIEPEGIVPWVRTSRRVIKNLELGEGITVPLLEEVVENVDGVPEREPNTYFIVSQKICEVYPDRDDFIIPNTIKGGNGVIIGASSFRQMLKKG